MNFLLQGEKMERYLTANAAFAKFSRNYMEQKKGLPIRPSEMGVLNILSGTPGPHTPVMLAQLLGVSKPMITAHLNVLMKKDYITKVQSPEDKRAYYVLPTEKALALVDQERSDVNSQLDALMEALGQSGFDMLVELTQKANEVMEARKDENT